MKQLEKLSDRLPYWLQDSFVDPCVLLFVSPMIIFHGAMFLVFN
jgi:hypothetical protein